MRAPRIPEADFFWSRDSPENGPHDTVQNVVQGSVDSGSVDVGAEMVISCAKRYPDVVVKITNTNNENGEAEYDVVSELVFGPKTLRVHLKEFDDFFAELSQERLYNIKEFHLMLRTWLAARSIDSDFGDKE